MTPSEYIEKLEREVEHLRRRNARLERELLGRGPQDRLTPQERALVDTLCRLHPRVASPAFLLENLPARDHARERHLSQVPTVVAHVREKLGYHAVETVHGQGYRLGAFLAKAA